jgi:hypothetical protein
VGGWVGWGGWVGEPGEGRRNYRSMQVEWLVTRKGRVIFFESSGVAPLILGVLSGLLMSAAPEGDY